MEGTSTLRRPPVRRAEVGIEWSSSPTFVRFFSFRATVHYKQNNQIRSTIYAQFAYICLSIILRESLLFAARYTYLCIGRRADCGIVLLGRKYIYVCVEVKIYFF